MDKKSDLFSEFLLDDYFTTKNILDKKVRLSTIDNYVISIQKSVQKWFEINFPFHTASTLDNNLKEWIDKINRLKYRPFEPNIMAALLSNPNPNDMLKLLKTMDRYVFLVFKIYQSRQHTGKNLFYAKAKGLYETGDIWELKRLIESRTDSDTKEYDIKQFQKNLSDIFQNVKEKKGFYAWNGIHYFLYEYELFLQGNEEQKITYDKFEKRDSIEHIYPQTATGECWQIAFGDFTNVQQVRLKNTLGNLLLLSVPKNSQLSNKSFEYKKRNQILNNPNEFKGYFNGSHSEIEVNTYFDWTSKEILGRGIKLLNFLEQRWEVKIGNFESKKKLLFLDFLQIDEHELSI
jgi:hypothetical protein